MWILLSMISVTEWIYHRNGCVMDGKVMMVLTAEVDPGVADHLWLSSMWRISTNHKLHSTLYGEPFSAVNIEFAIGAIIDSCVVDLISPDHVKRLRLR